MNCPYDFVNACSFPFVLPGWRPPLTTMWTVRNICYREIIDENDLLQATALAQRNQGGPGRVTFSVVLPSGSLEVAFPKLDPTSEMAWAPVQADAFPLSRVGIALHQDVPSDAVISLAIASCVPIMISRRIDSDVSIIQVVYDKTFIRHSKASWFLVNIRNALRSLHTQSCQSAHLHPSSLISPLYRRVLLTDNYRQCITLQSVQFLTRAENRLSNGGTAPPPDRYRQDDEIAAPLHTFFLRRSETDPLLVALRFFDYHQRIIEITYLDLHAISLHVAYALHLKGVQAGSLVPIALQHPADIIVSMLAVMQLGAAYVIMDTFNGHDHMATLESTIPGVHLSPIALVEHPYQDELEVRRGSTWNPRDEIQILLNTLKDGNFLDDIDLSFLPGEIDPDAVAFYTSLFSPQGHFLTMTSFSNAEARRSLICFFKKNVISSGAKIFITPGNPPWLLHQIIWNMFKEGTTLCCDLRVQSSTTLSEHIFDSVCTHLIWSGNEPNHISLAEALSCPKGHSTCSASCTATLNLKIILPETVLSTQEVKSFPEGVELVECADCCTPGYCPPSPPAIKHTIEIEIISSSPDTRITPTEVLELMPLGLKFHDDPLAQSVLKITDELVVKAGHISEAKAMEFIEKHTTIPVPHVHLVFRRRFEVYIVMDYVRGDSLDKTWDSFDDATRELVLAQLHDYIRQLRTIDVGHPASPGPLDGDRCRGRWFGFYDAGPFKTHSELVGWLNRRIELARDPALTLFSSTEHELVFSHQDLAPRNFILDEGKQLWIIDWERAGWYPAYFEYANVAFEHHCHPDSFIDRILPLLGEYNEEYKSLDGIRWVLESMPFAK